MGHQRWDSSELVSVGIQDDWEASGEGPRKVLGEESGFLGSHWEHRRKSQCDRSKS